MKVDSVVKTDQILPMFICLSVYLLLFMSVGRNSPYFISLSSVVSLSHLDANATSEFFPSAAGPKFTAGSA